MNNWTKLQSLCETRWASCYNALYTFMSAIKVVVSALEYLEADWDGSELLINNPKVLLCYYIGDDETCTRTSVSISDNYLPRIYCDL